MRVGTSRENTPVSPPAPRRRPGTAPGRASKTPPASGGPCRGRPSSARPPSARPTSAAAAAFPRGGQSLYPGQAEPGLRTLAESSSGFGSQLVLPTYPDRTGEIWEMYGDVGRSREISQLVLPSSPDRTGS